MAFESLLDIDSLLGVIAGLLVTLNWNTNSLKKSFNKLNKYFNKDIKIHARIEKKLDWIMGKSGVDIEKFNIDVNEELTGDYDLDE